MSSQPVRLRPHMVQEWTDERSLGHGWFVLLKPGYHYDPLDPEHREQSYGTKAEALGALVYCTPVKEGAPHG